MDSVLLIFLGYIAWCAMAFIVAKFVKLEGASSKPLSFLYVIMAAPMVLLDIISGKGTIR